MSNLRNHRPEESGLDPYRLARGFAQKLQLRFWRDEFWVWEDPEHRYRRITGTELKARLAVLLKQEIDSNFLTQQDRAAFVTVARLNNIIVALKGCALVHDTVKMPSWLKGEAPAMFAFQNGLVSIDWALTGFEPTVQPHSLEWFNDVVFPFKFDFNAKCPQWETFLTEIFDGDGERIALLQELFGYVLVPGNWMHKFFLLEGQGANGKSVVLKTLESLVGRENTSSVPLDSCGQRVQLVPTIGKLANLAPEADSSDTPHIGTVKAFTAGDTITIDRKGLTPVQVEPTAKLIVAANSRPTFVDRSDGLWRRLLVIPFNVTIPEEQQDRDLPVKLRTELPGIFNWASQGLVRLKEQGYFTQPQLVKNALEEYKLESNPVRMFLKEAGLKADPSEERFVLVSEVYRHYAQWSKANGFQPLNATNLGKELRKVFPKVRRTQKTVLKNRVTVYQGIYYTALTVEADREAIADVIEGRFSAA